MLEQYLVEHCSPTLAGLKTANLFSVRFIDEEELNQHMKQGVERFILAKILPLYPKNITYQMNLKR